MNKAIKGIYGITDPNLIADRDLYDTVSQAIDGGLSILQYRNKIAESSVLQQQAETLKTLCDANQVVFLINDNLSLAKEIGADGVHIGKHDGAIEEARLLLGEQAIIGVSCYNQLENAQRAEQAGANYIAYGRFFGSQTKPEALQAQPNLILQSKTKISGARPETSARPITLPIVAIGGITASNADSLLAAGADALAVIHGIFGQKDVYAATKALDLLYQAHQ